MGVEFQSLGLSDPILINFKLAVANDFTNALEIKTTRMRREYCWEDAYAKIPFCITRPSTAILSVQSPYMALISKFDRGIEGPLLFGPILGIGPFQDGIITKKFC